MKKISDKVIKEPHVTEKASALSLAAGAPAYVFVIDDRANKAMVRAAIKERYGVWPEGVNILKVPGKKILMRGRLGHKPGFKKAVVYLKPGDKIE